jgi:hypothetical protein
VTSRWLGDVDPNMMCCCVGVMLSASWQTTLLRCELLGPLYIAQYGGQYAIASVIHVSPFDTRLRTSSLGCVPLSA